MNKKEHPVLDDLWSHYKAFDFSFYKCGKNNEFSIFIVIGKTINELTNSWKNIASNIALNFQSQLTNKHEIWNIYVVFVIAFKISSDELRGVKYQIENDKYSSRKIVLDNIPIPIKYDEIVDRISKRIFCLDIDPNKPIEDIQKNLANVIDKKLYLHISSANLDGKTDENLKKRKEIFDKIRKDYFNEI